MWETLADLGWVTWATLPQGTHPQEVEHVENGRSGIGLFAVAGGLQPSSGGYTPTRVTPTAAATPAPAGPGATPAPTPKPTPTATPAVPGTTQPRYGGVLKFTTPADPDRFDRLRNITGDTAARDSWDLVFSKIIDFEWPKKGDPS